MLDTCTDNKNLNEIEIVASQQAVNLSSPKFANAVILSSRFLDWRPKAHVHTRDPVWPLKRLSKVGCTCQSFLTPIVKGVEIIEPRRGSPLRRFGATWAWNLQSVLCCFDCVYTHRRNMEDAQSPRAGTCTGWCSHDSKQHPISRHYRRVVSSCLGIAHPSLYRPCHLGPTLARLI